MSLRAIVKSLQLIPQSHSLGGIKKTSVENEASVDTIWSYKMNVASITQIIWAMGESEQCLEQFEALVRSFKTGVPKLGSGGPLSCSLAGWKFIVCLD